MSQPLNPIDLWSLTTLLEYQPDFIKSADQRDLGVSVDNVDSELFADPRTGSWPCHTPAATWASYSLWKNANFDKNDAATAAVESRLLTFARHYGISRECQDVAKKIEEEREKLAKAAHEGGRPDSDFAVVWTNDDGSVERHMPMRNVVETTIAAAYFREKSSMFLRSTSFDFRRSVADKILTKAASYSTDLPEEVISSLERASCRGVSVPSEASRAIMARAALGQKSASEDIRVRSRAMQELAGLMVAQPASTSDYSSRVAIAQAIDAFDKAAGFAELVARGDLQSPEDIMFNIPFSKASQELAMHTSTATGCVYKLADLERVPLHSIRELLGKEVADSLSEDGLHVSGKLAAEIVPTLPRPDASVLDDIMTENGLGSVGKEAAEFSISNQFLREIQERLGRLPDVGVYSSN
jgi:hypothetical protein